MGACNSACGSSKKDDAPEYEEIRVLGEGGTSKVSMVVDRKTKKKYALKQLRRTERKEEDDESKAMFDQEVSILTRLKHPNVIEYIRSYVSKQGDLCLVTGLCEGGELFDRLQSGSFSEKTASSVARTMLEAVQYVHAQQVAHRDIKPENFVFETKDENASLRLIDFGCAVLARDDDFIRTLAGTPYYVAPEVLSTAWKSKRTGQIWRCSDMWSIGVVLFLMLTGEVPFNAMDQRQLFARIARGEYKFPARSPSEPELSEAARDLVSKLLTVDPLKRCTAYQALHHPFITGAAPLSDQPLPARIVEGFKAFRVQNRLQLAVGRALRMDLTEQDRRELQALFHRFDKDRNGRLGPDEVSELMKQIGGGQQLLRDLMQHADQDQDGSLTQGELETALAVGRLGASSNDHLLLNFNKFDLDKDGYLSAHEVQQMCLNLDRPAVEQMIKDVDRDGNGRIDFQEWLAALRTTKARSPPLANKRSLQPQHSGQDSAASPRTNGSSYRDSRADRNPDRDVSQRPAESKRQWDSSTSPRASSPRTDDYYVNTSDLSPRPQQAQPRSPASINEWDYHRDQGGTAAAAHYRYQDQSPAHTAASPYGRRPAADDFTPVFLPPPAQFSYDEAGTAAASYAYGTQGAPAQRTHAQARRQVTFHEEDE